MNREEIIRGLRANTVSERTKGEAIALLLQDEKQLHSYQQFRETGIRRLQKKNDEYAKLSEEHKKLKAAYDDLYGMYLEVNFSAIE